MNIFLFVLLLLRLLTAAVTIIYTRNVNPELSSLTCTVYKTCFCRFSSTEYHAKFWQYLMLSLLKGFRWKSLIRLLNISLCHFCIGLCNCTLYAYMIVLSPFLSPMSSSSYQCVFLLKFYYFLKFFECTKIWNFEIFWMY